MKTIEEINEKYAKEMLSSSGADEMPDIYDEDPKKSSRRSGQ